MHEDIITRDSNVFNLTSEEVRSIFGLSKRSLQNYRYNRQIPYTSIGGKILYPQSAIYKLLESRYVRALR